MTAIFIRRPPRGVKGRQKQVENLLNIPSEDFGHIWLLVGGFEMVFKIDLKQNVGVLIYQNYMFA